MVKNKKASVKIILCLTLLASCNQKSDNIVVNPNTTPKTDLISDVVKEGRINSYNSFLFNYPDDICVIPLAVNMAEQHGYEKAYSDLFYAVYSTFNNNSIEVDSTTQKYLLYYLNKGIEQKDTDCVWITCKLYLTGKFVEKDTSVAKKTLMQIYPLNDVETLYWPYINEHFNL